ncbi:hypothetical protein C8Q75DRAFT_208291 [Abortiporus biennis]|nr:hypothetical protein C8Q75DRAFT_208291 [Abortiporus biennis]
MRFGTRNLYYLRISSHAILPLYLYLDEQHVDWMSEQVLQHVLADLRPLIPIKLMNEPDIFSSSSSSGKKTGGTLDVHRGDTYQFGYFLRKSDPHVVVVKARNFVAAPPATTTTTTRTKPQPHNYSSTKRKSKPKPKPTATKRKREAIEKEKEKKADVNKNKKLRTKAKGKQRAVDSDEEEEEPIEISSEDEDEFGESNLDVPTIPRRSTRSRKVIAGGYRDDEDDEVLEVQMGGATAPAEQEPEAMDVDVENPPETQTAPKNPTVPSLDDDNLITMDEEEEPMMPPPTQPPSIKREETETPLNVGDMSETIDVDSYENPNLTSTSTSTSTYQPPPNPPPDEEYIHHPLEISEDEKEEKPKPILKLQYSGFNIHERCLCVIVEPYPPIRSSTQRSASLRPTGLIPPNRQSSIAPPDFVMSSSSTSAGKLRARTPLFLPDDDEYDNIRGETPGPSMGRQRSRPPVPLFHEGTAAEEDEDNDNGGMFELSQILQSVGGHTAIAAEDEDEMEGAVFFGDADENREL